MTKHRLLTVMIAITLGVLWVSSDLGAAKKPGPTGEIPMTATFGDTEADGLTSDGNGDYVNGVGGVRAVLVSAGNFVLDTRDSMRSFGLHFPSACATEVGGGDVTVEFFSTAQLNAEGGLLGMTLNLPRSSDASVFFSLEGSQYFVRFDPDGDFGGSSVAVQITRTASDRWEIVPEPSATASLLKQPLRGKPVITWVADCAIPFTLTITCNNSSDCPLPSP